jgi:hypothetical protein
MPSSRRPRAARLRTTSAGVHLLSCPRAVDRLVRAAGLDAGDLVIDFGAGTGAITAPLAGTGSRVLAVERDAAFVRSLLGAVYRRPGAPARHVLGDLVAHRLAHRVLRAHDTTPATPAGEVHVGRWTAVAAAFADDRAVSPPPLPRALGSGHGRVRDR